MNCRELTAMLVDFLDDELPPAMRAACRRHLASCPDCSAYLASYQATIHLARSAFQEDECESATLVNQLISRLSV